MDMSALDMDFADLTHLARGSTDTDQKPKRALERGGSDAKPPVAKAKSAASTDDIVAAAAIPVTTRPQEVLQPSDTAAVLTLLQQLVAKVDTSGSAVADLTDLKESVRIMESNVTNLHSDVKDVKGDIAKAMAKADSTEKALQDLQDQVTALKIAEVNWTKGGVGDQSWPKLGEGASTLAGKGRWERHLTAGEGATTASKGSEPTGSENPTYWTGQDQVIVGVFHPTAIRRCVSRVPGWCLRRCHR